MADLMNLITEIVALYEKHGWRLERVLLQPETRARIGSQNFGQATNTEAQIDALWFSRPSYQQREAWELRLIAETPYALFQTFEADESEEQREELRREMEAQMREYSAK